MIQEQDVLCVSGEPFYSGERTVTIRRQTVGGFGLSIKVQVLRNAGEEVTLTVSFLKRAPAFLKLPLNEDCACAPSDQSSGTSSPLCDSGLHLNYHPNNTDTLSCSSWPTSPGLRWEKRWCDLRLIPLLHARFSQYVPGTDLSRQNAFQVVAVDGVCSGVIQCLSAEDCIDWLQAIATNISNLTKHNSPNVRDRKSRPERKDTSDPRAGSTQWRRPDSEQTDGGMRGPEVLLSNATEHREKRHRVPQRPARAGSRRIVYMGWCEAREQDPLQDRVYSPSFLALRGSCLYKFLAPPVTTWDWTRAEKTFSVYEIMCKILKDSDLLDRRKHCFTVQSESGEDLYFSVELDCDLAQWERAFQTATFLEVERIQCKTYACVLESHLMGLTIDFSTGFICFDAATKAVLWRYKFSQLKGSSDDGKSKIKFLFQNPDTKQIEAKELEFSNLFAVLHCIHSFFAAKVACLDPLFLGGQATAPAAAGSAGTSKAKYPA
ncbi:Gamma-1-syntrophin [Tupaia chinensis]|uniref:Gamma-1-syntrophin n=1 Tax=Tupaia chinensis TaxID=246437 RepID=L9LBL6_TUPCH|nr:Gamma-1-syntrophin [Tupaia chinensis]